MWEWRPFKNGARSDGLRLSHWVKASVDPESDSKWTKEETDYLFELVRQYDARFYVVHDRYEFPSPEGSSRTLEDLKDRYFSVCRKLVRNRPWPGDEASKAALLSSLAFDKDREVMRKQYVISLETRTPEQIAEEDALYLELEKLKENERRFKKERDELLRTLLGIESGLPDIPVEEDGLQGLSTDTKKKKKAVAGSVEPQTPITPSASASNAMPPPQPKKTAKYSDAQTSSSSKAPHSPVHLRSTKIPQLKQATAQRIAQVLNEVGVVHNRLVMPTRDNIARLEAVIHDAGIVVEKKKTLDKLDQDIATMKARLAALRGEATEEDAGSVPQTPMEVEEGPDESVVDGRAQSVLSTKSARGRKQGLTEPTMLIPRAWHRCVSRRATLARCFTSGAPAPTPKHSIYVSESTNPYFNLTFEDWLFRHKSPDQPLLLVYRDQPCVVIGRNQNPWKEVNLRASRRTGIPFIRRHSGGGTVYHDLGNTNFSIHLPRASFDRHATAQVVMKAVRSLGVDATVNDRNDICVGKEKICFIPPSIVKDRAYHHGTMLISTRLDTLGELLRSGKDTMETRGVASVRSPVCNLQQYHPGTTHEKFVDAMIHAFRQEYGTWDWAFGQTPEFTYKIQKSFSWGSTDFLDASYQSAELRSKHGIILSCTFTHSEHSDSSLLTGLEKLAQGLEGERYGFVDESVAVFASSIDERIGEVWQWLRTEMDS
ncbi:LOW QUALITY PROTEIN: hypothetical protein ACG7TL_004105 [Trametes sanguinea]